MLLPPTHSLKTEALLTSFSLIFQYPLQNIYMMCFYYFNLSEHNGYHSCSPVNRILLALNIQRRQICVTSQEANVGSYWNAFIHSQLAHLLKTILSKLMNFLLFGQDRIYNGKWISRDGVCHWIIELCEWL